MNTEKNMIKMRVAVRDDDMATIQALLQSDFDFTQSISNFPSMISLSIKYSSLGAFKLMLKCNKTKFLDYLHENSNLLGRIYSSNRNTISERREVIKFLLENGNKINKKHDQIIQGIIDTDDDKTCKLLFDLHGGMFMKKSMVTHILYHSVKPNNSHKIASYLIKKLTKGDMANLFKRAFNNRNKFLIKFLFEHGLDKSVITKNNISVYEPLLPYDEDDYALFKLIVDFEKNGDIKTSLLHKNLAAFTAADYGLYKPLLDMFDLGADPNYNNLITKVAGNIIYNGSGHDKYKMIKKLIEMGVNPNVTDGINRNLFHIIFHSHKGDISPLIDIFEILINLGLDINGVDNFGETVAHYIGESKYTQRSKLLKHIITKFGADMTIKNNDGLNPLMLICKQRSWRRISEDGVIDIIMNNSKCNINDVSVRGYTALTLAVSAQAWDYVEALLKHDVDPCIVDSDGSGVYHYLEYSKDNDRYENICNLLDDKVIAIEGKSG